MAFRNWSNPAHVAELAKIWNVSPEDIPHVTPPTHAMQIFRYAEQGSIRFLWIIGTNPAATIPELQRVRKILGEEGLFVVVQDPFLTETAALADLVLPAAMWGEKDRMHYQSWIVPFTFAVRRFRRRGKHVRTLTYSPITPAEWIFAIKMVDL